MKKKENSSSKSRLNLFLKKPPKSRLPKRGISLSSKDYKGIQKAAQKKDLLQRKLDEAKFPLAKAQLQAIGITKERWAAVGEQEDIAYKNYIEEVLLHDPAALPDDFFRKPLCRDVTIKECEQKVCVDDPMPFDVDEIWLEGGSNTSHTSGLVSAGNSVDYYARVDGSSYRDWGMYHRRTKESTGAICLRATVTLVETARIRRVGIYFDGPLETSTGGMSNGLFLDGQIFAFLVDSYGDGWQKSEFQVSVETPGGSLTRQVPSSDTVRTYNNPPRAYQDYADPYRTGGDYRKLPPKRVAHFNHTYPAGTLFLVEVRISHWIKACGKQSFGSVWHCFDAQPYIVLESCSWQWPS